MPRDANIPLFLWVATAIVVHLFWGGGAHKAALVMEEQLDLKRFAESVQQQVRLTNQTLEIALVEEAPADEPAEDPAAKDPETLLPELDANKKPEPTEPDTPKPEQKTPEPKKPELKKPEIEVEPKPKPPQAKPKPVEHLKNRISVKQHVKDKNQKDNPDARFQAEHANRVEEETQARITSTDQNAEQPTPGGQHQSPAKEPGNADHNKVAQAEDLPGEPDRAPKEAASEPTKPKPAQAPPKPVAPPARAAAKPAKPPPRAAQPAQTAQPKVRAQDSFPETLRGLDGPFSVPKQQQGRAAQRARRKRNRVLPVPRSADPTDLLGLGAQGTTPGGLSLNLSPQAAFNVVGADRLTQERKADGERRRSAHRGSWKPMNPERWKGAIENYVASVKPGNQTALNTKQSPFASYLNAIHNRLHPIFADGFLGSLASLPANHPLNKNPKMVTVLEIVLRKEDGGLVKRGVTKSSGVTAFDIAVLASVDKAAPFGAAPDSIVSADGNIYLHWGFHRDRLYACSTYNAKPYLLKVEPKSAPPKLAPPKNKPEGHQQSAPDRDQRRGSRDETRKDQRTARR